MLGKLDRARIALFVIEPREIVERYGIQRFRPQDTLIFAGRAIEIMQNELHIGEFAARLDGGVVILEPRGENAFSDLGLAVDVVELRQPDGDALVGMLFLLLLEERDRLGQVALAHQEIGFHDGRQSRLPSG